jgi:hypothetical protein
MKNWTADSGDCRQELVFIGQNIDFTQLTSELDACLLTDEEMALGLRAGVCCLIHSALGTKRPPDPLLALQGLSQVPWLWASQYGCKYAASVATP